MLLSFSLDYIKTRRTELEAWLHHLPEMHATHSGAKDPQQQAYYRRFLTEDANKPPLPLRRIFPEYISTNINSPGNGRGPTGEGDEFDDVVEGKQKV
jgi:hypothetical protein